MVRIFFRLPETLSIFQAAITYIPYQNRANANKTAYNSRLIFSTERQT
ncbi:hypothetical protein ACKLNO_04470 [Neisseriaceae bacterium B1]